MEKFSNLNLNTIQREHWAIDNIFTQNNISGVSSLIYSTIKNKIVSYESDNDKTYRASNDDLKPIDFNVPYSPVINYNQDKSYFLISQKWIGNVIEINNNSFIAKLIDKTNNGTYEIGEFEIKEVSEDDKSLLKIGSTFYFSVGFRNDKNGQKSKSNVLRFQRLANWTEDEMFNAIDSANQLNESIKWEDE
jgi:hypothetical protein